MSCGCNNKTPRCSESSLEELKKLIESLVDYKVKTIIAELKCGKGNGGNNGNNGGSGNSLDADTLRDYVRRIEVAGAVAERAKDHCMQSQNTIEEMIAQFSLKLADGFNITGVFTNAQGHKIHIKHGIIIRIES